MSDMTNSELATFLRATFPTEGVGPITRAQRLAIHAAADRLAAQAGEAHGAETVKQGSVHEHAVAESDAPKGESRG